MVKADSVINRKRDKNKIDPENEKMNATKASASTQTVFGFARPPARQGLPDIVAEAVAMFEGRLVLDEPSRS